MLIKSDGYPTYHLANVIDDNGVCICDSSKYYTKSGTSCICDPALFRIN